VTGRGLIIIGSLLMAAGILLGAFAAHVLNAQFSNYATTLWHKASFYHLTHALALTGLGFYAQRSSTPSPAYARTGWLWLLGVLLFSGSLYLIALTGVSQLGLLAPVGGILMVAGWLQLAWHFARSNK